MNAIDRINALIEDGARIVFRHDGALCIATEAGSEEVCYNLLSSPDDPYSSASVEWHELRFGKAELLEAAENPTPENFVKLRLLRERDMDQARAGA
jgi:hypothetical protein